MGALLVCNDYGDEGSGAKSNRIYDLVRGLIADEFNNGGGVALSIPERCVRAPGAMRAAGAMARR